MMPLAEFARATPFFVIAHRGSSGIAPENTLAAMRIAVEGGARMVELDVQFSQDSKSVVFHDAVLGRTTNGHGYVRNKTFDELRALDAGSWFATDFANERIPLLSEVLDVLRDKAYLLLELKPLDAHTPLADIDAIVDTIRTLELGAYTLFASFDHTTLRHVKHLDRALHTVALNVPGDNRLPSVVCKACGADAYGCSISELNHARSDDAKAHNIPVGVYTVNEEAELRKALAHGVHAVVSNYPERLTAVLAHPFTS